MWWLIGRLIFPKALKGWRRGGLLIILFVGLDAAISIFVVAPLAALGGRVPLPCRAEPDRPFAAGSARAETDQGCLAMAGQ